MGYLKLLVYIFYLKYLFHFFELLFLFFIYFSPPSLYIFLFNWNSFIIHFKFIYFFTSFFIFLFIIISSFQKLFKKHTMKVKEDEEGREDNAANNYMQRSIILHAHYYSYGMESYQVSKKRVLNSII